MLHLLMPILLQRQSVPSSINRSTMEIDSHLQRGLGLQGLVKKAKQIVLQKLWIFTTAGMDPFGNGLQVLAQNFETVIPAEIAHIFILYVFILLKLKTLKLAEECEGSNDREVNNDPNPHSCCKVSTCSYCS